MDIIAASPEIPMVVEGMVVITTGDDRTAAEDMTGYRKCKIPELRDTA